MPRPHKYRLIFSNPEFKNFRSEDNEKNEIIILSLDEYESLRLADYEGLYQEKAAELMNISRQTFGNIISSAHKKMADFIINGKSLKIDGGVTKKSTIDSKLFMCCDCKFKWGFNSIEKENQECIKCKSSNIHSSSNEIENCDNGCKFYKREVSDEN